MHSVNVPPTHKTDSLQVSEKFLNIALNNNE